jgi:acyl carrier protein
MADMTPADAVLPILREALDRVNDIQSDDKKIPFVLEAPLFGRPGILDSLGLVRLVVNLQQLVQEQLGAEIDLFDEKVFTPECQPFRTLRALADHVRALLADRG